MCLWRAGLDGPRFSTGRLCGFMGGLCGLLLLRSHSALDFSLCLGTGVSSRPGIWSGLVFGKGCIALDSLICLFRPYERLQHFSTSKSRFVQSFNLSVDQNNRSVTKSIILYDGAQCVLVIVSLVLLHIPLLINYCSHQTILLSHKSIYMARALSVVESYGNREVFESSVVVVIVVWERVVRERIVRAADVPSTFRHTFRKQASRNDRHAASSPRASPLSIHALAESTL